MKRNILFLVMLLAVLPLRAATNVSGNIGTDQTWTPGGSPYILTGLVTVLGSNNPVLTIEKGVEVLANQGAALIINDHASNRGTLIVNGTAANPVRFRSNGTLTRGFWRGLYIGNAPGATESSVHHAVIEHAGSTNPTRGGVTTIADSFYMKEVTIRENLTAGVLVTGGDFGITFSEISSNSGPGINAVSGAVLRFSSVKFLNNTGVAVTAPAAMLLQSRGSNIATGNATGGNGLEIRAGTINTSTDWFWLGADFPYLVSGAVIVRAVNATANVPALRIKAGNKVRFRSGADLLISHGERGALQVEGTEQEPVLFTSDGPVTAGHWMGIGFSTGATATTPASKISYATIEYAGNNGFQRAGIDVRSGSVTLDHVTVRNCLLRGVSLSAGSLTVTDSAISTNSGPGLFVSAGTLTLTGNTFTNNLGYAVTLAATVPLLSASGNSATGNGTGGNNQDAIEYRAGTINSNMTWPRPGITLPYVISGLVLVRATNVNASVPVLTIAPGNTIKFNQGAELLINHDERSVLQANGTADEPILFTANGSTPTPGFWRGIGFSTAATPTTPPSSISYATIEYGGSSGFQRAGIDVRSGSVTLDRVTVRNSQLRGVSLSTGSLTVTNSTISTNSGPGLTASSGTLTLTANTFTSNLGYAVSLAPAVPLVSASGNSATGNGTGGNNQDAIEYSAGMISSSMTWPRPGIEFPYVISGLLKVRAVNASANVPVLTIAPGNKIKFNQNAELLINFEERGVLQANGAADEPILFTANGSTPTPGFWRGIGFSTAATPSTPPSRISHATIEYGGSTGFQRAGVDVRSGSVSLDHITVRNNVFSGIWQSAGALTVTESTISGNTGPGMKVTGGTGLSLERVNLTSNSGNAIDILPTVPLLAVDELTATSNAAGGNAICISAGRITANTTWPVSTLPYVLTGTVDVSDASSPVLTIPPGSNIRFNSSAILLIHEGNFGALRAEGTATSPILFTSNGLPNPGFWGGIIFGTASGPPSRISYATIEYAGQVGFQNGGITVRNHSPEFDHLVLRNNLWAGLAARDSGTPRISNSQFIGNTQAIATRGNAKVHATLNYWGSPDGPCPAPCTVAQFLTSALIYEPWLVSVPSDPLFLASATHKNPTFNPLIGTQSFVDYSTSMSAEVTISIRNAAGQVVRTLSQSESPGSIVWNGKDESGATQPNGTYKYDIETTAPSQPPATVARGVAVIDSSRTLTLSNHTVSELFFSPNDDAVQDSTTVSAVSNFDDTSWALNVLDSSNNIVRTHTGAGLTFAFTWNGRDGASAMRPDGVYKLRLDASVGVAPAGASVTKDGSTTLDNTLPVAVITTPTAGLISNIHASDGITTLTPTGTASDLNLKQWELLVNSPTGSWLSLEWANQPVTDGALIVVNHERHEGPWNSAASGVNGVHALKLTVFDKAGNRAETLVSPLDVQHFSATQNNVHEFNAVAGNTLKYTSKIPTLPVRVTESIVIKNLEGTVVRQLLSPAVRNPGSHDDFFNGRNDAGELLPDGPYFYVATVKSDGHTLVWDQSDVLNWGQTAHTNSLNVQPYDPFNNKPLTFQYHFNLPARVSVGTSTATGGFVGNCDAPDDTFFCPANKIWQESGTHTYTWWGVDHTGSYRAIRNIGIVSIVNETNPFPKNAAILFGSKPKLENVKVTPPVFGPEVGMPQLIEFDLTTLNSDAANVKVELVNLTTKSTLRTIVAKRPAGHGVVEWDGRSDSGMHVAPGRYNVIVTVTDAIGNVVRSGILTEIQY